MFLWGASTYQMSAGNTIQQTDFLIIGKVRGGGFSRAPTLDFQRADFDPFRRLVGSVPWQAVLKNRGIQKSWTFFKKEILKAQEQALLMRQKTSQAEQRVLAGTQGEKKKKKWGRQLRKNAWML